MKFSDKNEEKGHNSNAGHICGTTCDSPAQSQPHRGFAGTLTYSNFQTLWQDTNDHLANQTTQTFISNF